MNRVPRLLAFLLLAMCQAALAAAQTVPSSFKDMQFLVGTGDRVTVVDTSGARITGRISELDVSTLLITSGSGPHRFTQDDVIVVRQRKADPLENGAVIGAVIGAGMGIMTELSCGGAGWVTVGSTLWGVGVGVFTDALLKTPTDVFKNGSGKAGAWSVAPVVGRGTAGARLALRWQFSQRHKAL